MIRIIAGTYRHRRIVQPESQGVRPTMDRVREAIFSALGPVKGTMVLDLFAGSGAFGFEALSRQAEHVDFVDAFKLSTAAMAKTASEFKLPSKSYRLHLLDYMSALRELQKEKFDLVFMDPPYAMNVTAAVSSFLVEHDMLSPLARLVVETFEPSAEMTGFEARLYRYGHHHIGIYRRTL